MFPIEIVNKILCYVSEMNNDMIIRQYHMITNKEYYKINFYTDLLWRIKSNLVMKRLYPVYPDYYANFNNKDTIELYKWCTLHYEHQLRENTISPNLK
jgi:hypothetical protein